MDFGALPNLHARVEGPLNFRLILQPVMALIFAWRDARIDTREGATPYFHRILLRPGERGQTLASAWSSLGIMLALAVALDCAFQWMTRGQVSLLMALAVAGLLCVLPYTMVRGPAARLMRARLRRTAGAGKNPDKNRDTEPETRP